MTMDFSISTVLKLALPLIGFFISTFSNVNSTAPSGDGRWQNPCGLSAMPPNIAGLPPPPMDAPRSPADIVTSMLLRIREGQSYSSDHQDKIGMERIRSMRHIAFLNTLHNDGFPAVKELTEEEIENSVHNVTKTHLESYRALSIITVFFEQMKYDEQIYESSLYLQNIVKVESKLYDVLCYMDEAISNLGANIDHVTREGMHMHLGTISDKMDRYERDYITVKDTTKIMDNLIVTYTAIHNSLSV